MIRWQWARFEELTGDELFEILKIRQEVFVVEQECAYQDADDLDRSCWHLLGRKDGGAGQTLCAYLRLVFPGEKYDGPAIGRVLTIKEVRGKGIGRQMIGKALAWAGEQYPGMDIRMSAQLYLETFYTGFGFVRDSAPYDEDGIPHIDMVKKWG